MGLRKLWGLVGDGSVAEGSRRRSLLASRGIEVVEAGVIAIDASARTAETTTGRLDGDHLVVALGADVRPEQARAVYEDGILRIELPLAQPDARPRTVPVQTPRS